MGFYDNAYKSLPQMADSRTVFNQLNQSLPPVWRAAYRPKSGSIVPVTPTGVRGENGGFSYLFDIQAAGSPVDSRVVAAWGLSRYEPSNTRDKSRSAGLGRGVWSSLHPGRDRGHFLAHTMGGELDMNLFPQLATVNRGGEWVRMEEHARSNPGTFCFVRPIYYNDTWTPSQLEYGIFKMPPADAPGPWITRFFN